MTMHWSRQRFLGCDAQRVTGQVWKRNFLRKLYRSSSCIRSTSIWAAHFFLYSVVDARRILTFFISVPYCGRWACATGRSRCRYFVWLFIELKPVSVYLILTSCRSQLLNYSQMGFCLLSSKMQRLRLNVSWCHCFFRHPKWKKAWELTPIPSRQLTVAVSGKTTTSTIILRMHEIWSTKSFDEIQCRK